MGRTIKKILIANRGEIAVRIIRACREMGIRSVAVFSEADKVACHVGMADEAYHIGPSPSSESYLDQEKILDVARLANVDAIHPGYGFLAENSSFAQRCSDEGITFIGPDPETISLLGDKLQARRSAIDAGLTIIPGTKIDQDNPAAVLEGAKKIGFPVLIKATAGGGGKGMRVVESERQFEEALQRAISEASSAFGDGRVFLEKYLERPRHIEIQILADRQGNVVHLGERECSIQRRHQKLIEESPSPMVDEKLRRRMGEAATNIARRTGYVGAGTVEFMVDEDGSFYFLEVNTRLQVEHPVTEMVTGIDLVKEQIQIAEGKKLSFTQDGIKFNGHAIECRICAESPEQDFAPSTGQLTHFRPPGGPGVRIDSGVDIFSDIPVFYDPLIAKLIVWGANRTEAIKRMQRALEEFRLSGVSTTIGFHKAIMGNAEFLKGNLSTKFLSEQYPDNRYFCGDDRLFMHAAIAAALDKFVGERKLSLIGKRQAEQVQSGWKNHYRRQNLQPFKGRR